MDPGVLTPESWLEAQDVTQELVIKVAVEGGQTTYRPRVGMGLGSRYSRQKQE